MKYSAGIGSVYVSERAESLCGGMGMSGVREGDGVGCTIDRQAVSNIQMY